MLYFKAGYAIMVLQKGGECMKLSFYTGGYTATGYAPGHEERGISYYEWDSDTDTLQKRIFYGPVNPSWLLLHPNKKVLYCVNETKNGAVQCYSVTENGVEKLLCTVDSLGDDPCHLALSPDAKLLAVSNYSSGSIAFYALQKDGTFGELLYRHPFSGSGNLQRRQASQHTHSSTFAGGYCYICELGCDGIYRIAVEKILSGTACASDMEQVFDFKKDGNVTGIRLGCFTKDEKYYFAGGELDIRMYGFETEGMNPICSVETAPLKEENTFAHIALNADESKVYGSVRGENKIVCCDVRDGVLSGLQSYDCGGNCPRYFALCEPYLIVANQGSDELVIFEWMTNGSLKERKRIQETAPTAVVLK